ncbi:hypothetical protein PROPEN_02960 [Proteus penneri ATCC 35198]|nr:hypothetical protein PROPEN_02960 [Proteus penneri ATCC 35198]
MLLFYIFYFSYSLVVLFLYNCLFINMLSLFSCIQNSLFAIKFKIIE